jgi:hypothetical protein
VPRFIQSLLLGFAAVPMILAGNVYGTIRSMNAPVQGASVSMTCGKESVPGKTDADGVYRLFVRATGACQLVVDIPGRRLTAPVYSYDRPTAYDFDVMCQGNNCVLQKR